MAFTYPNWLKSLNTLLVARRVRPRATARPRPQVRLGLEELDGRIVPATLVVTTDGDTGFGSLRERISSAAWGDTITFDPSLNGARIEMGLSTFVIDRSLTIDASALSSGITVDGNGYNTVFWVQSSTVVGLTNLTITGGRGAYGGGVLNLGTLTMQDCIVTGNSAFSPDRVSGGAGGGIYNSSRLTLDSCTLTDNAADFRGGAIFNDGSVLTLRNSTVANNAAYGGEGGGGIYNSGASTTVVIESSEISGNSGIRGGGVANLSGTLTVRNSTLTENSGAGGGGIYNGGALRTVHGTYVDAGAVTVVNSTLAGNLKGGAIYNTEGSTVTVLNSTVAGNVADDIFNIQNFGGGGIHNEGVVYLGNSIVANNTSTRWRAPDVKGSVTSLGHNLIGATTGITGGLDVTDLINVDAGLDPAGLRNNGGPTTTIALLRTSPAFDAGDNAIALLAGLTTDQRGTGFDRVVNGTVNIGAFEGNLPPLVPTVVEITAPGGTYNGSPFAASVQVTGTGTITGAPAVTYYDNTRLRDLGTTAPTDAGNYTVTATYPGDDSHDGSTAEVSFDIAKAPSSVSVGGDTFVYTGATHAGGAAVVSGVGTGITQTVVLTYSGDRLNAGSYTVTATYAGDENHLGSTGTASVVISKAPSSVSVTGGTFVYTGAAHGGGTAVVSGVGTGITQNVTWSYAGNRVRAGTYTATATYAGDENHLGSTGSATVTIRPRVVTVRPLNPAAAVTPGAITLNLAVPNGQGFNSPEVARQFNGTTFMVRILSANGLVSLGTATGIARTNANGTITVSFRLSADLRAKLAARSGGAIQLGLIARAGDGNSVIQQTVATPAPRALSAYPTLRTTRK